MNTYPAKNIINVAMAGHSGAGKTSLAEAMLYLAGASDRRGKVGEGNTVCDSDPEEIRRKTSVSTAVAPFEWKNKKINLLDTPGLFDFQGGLYEAARAAESRYHRACRQERRFRRYGKGFCGSGKARPV